MAVSAGRVSMGAVQRTDGPESGGVRGCPRREAARLLLASAAMGIVPVIAASQSSRSAERPPGDGTRPAFDEIYRGRRIQGVSLSREGLTVLDAAWHVTVDGQPLHLMCRADGSWLSMLDHYGWYRTPLEATRAAVDELGPRERLRELAPGPLGGGHSHRKAEHGVRA